MVEDQPSHEAGSFLRELRCGGEHWLKQYKSISKEVMQATMILDVDNIDAKTQAILSKFDMLVIGMCEGDEQTGEVWCEKKEINLKDYAENEDDGM